MNHIYVKQTDMPDSCLNCSMLRFYEDDNSGDYYDCKALEFLGEDEMICSGWSLTESLKHTRSPKCPLRIIPFKCLEILDGDKNEQ